MRYLIPLLLAAAPLFSQECSLDSKDASPLRVTESTIEVNGRSKKVYDILQEDGTFGLVRKEGECFNVAVENHTTNPLTLHWHGLILPWNQDGVAYNSQAPIPPNHREIYNFPLKQWGTYWLHSHYGLQEQDLMAAPLIIHRDKDENQNVVVFLEDFSFTPTAKIWQDLRANYDKEKPSDWENCNTLFDIQYDAFLCNRRTPENPYIAIVEPGSKVKLRLINGASSTNFFVLIDDLKCEAIALDGNPIEPYRGMTFDIAAAQTMDFMIEIPDKEGAYPIYALAQGMNKNAAMLLKTPKAHTIPLTSKMKNPFQRIENQDGRYQSVKGLERKEPTKRFTCTLSGDMWRYIWMINDKVFPHNTPLRVQEGDRVEITFVNDTLMGHPMHLHGHTFQVTKLNGSSLYGPMRNTVFVPPGETVTIEFDADNPGNWALQCHFLYHLWAGMYTTLLYEGVEPLKFSQQTIERYLNRYGGDR